MLTAAVIHLKAATDGQIPQATGRGVHGFWFHHWGQAAPKIADQLHAEKQLSPYTLSPLMGLQHSSSNRVMNISKGMKTWFRVTTLTRSLSVALLDKWLPALDGEIQIPQPKISKGYDIPDQPGVRWQVIGASLSPEEHPWARQISYKEMERERLFATHPPIRWRLGFETPTAFHGSAGHFPFPLPDSLVASWMRRWQAFAPIRMPEDLPNLVRQHIVISAYSLKTRPVRAGKRLTVGCTGWITLRALKMHPANRAALDALSAYAFYAGSGHRTTQGMGVTICD